MVAVPKSVTANSSFVDIKPASFFKTDFCHRCSLRKKAGYLYQDGLGSEIIPN